MDNAVKNATGKDLLVVEDWNATIGHDAYKQTGTSGRF